MNYTLDQMLFFYTDAVLSRIDYMQDVRVAVWGDEKGLEKYMTRIVEG
ncbi:hypothetical protein [Lucifera butyrica]|nr:hypothetical protein [Lucifera butyrica]